MNVKFQQHILLVATSRRLGRSPFHPLGTAPKNRKPNLKAERTAAGERAFNEQIARRDQVRHPRYLNSHEWKRLMEQHVC